MLSNYVQQIFFHHFKTVELNIIPINVPKDSCKQNKMISKTLFMYILMNNNLMILFEKIFVTKIITHDNS